MHYSLTKASLWNLSGYLYLLLASFIATPILLGTLGLTNFGLYALAIASTSLFASLDLGLPQAVIRLFARAQDKETLSKIWHTSFWLLSVTGLVTALLSVPLFFKLSLSTVSIIFLSGIIFLNNLVVHALCLPQAEGRFGIYNLKTFIVGSANTWIAAIATLYRPSLETVFLVQFLSYLVTLAIVYPYKRTINAGSHFDYRTGKELVTFGLKNQVGKLFGQIGAQYGKFILGTLSPLALSSYSIAVGLVQKVAGGVSAIATAFYPASARGVKLIGVYHRLQLMLGGLGVIGVIAYYIAGRAFLVFWLADPEVVLAVSRALSTLVWYLAILLLTPLASSILDGHGRPELTSLFATLTISLEVVLAIFLFPRLGFMAPPTAALISICVTTPFLLITAEKVIKK
ncbi:MAG: Wzx [Microgenomates group bacterium GW2011_GWF2_47_9]|nr:MAG: Wzx [Microgenomates group bacterium GW2011_GWF2_47_9]